MSNTAQESRKKNIIVYSVFGVVLLVFCVYAYESFFSTSPAPVSQSPVIVTKPSGTAPRAGSAGGAQAGSRESGQPTGQGVAAGVAATKMASTSSSLDPTLDERAMLRTESLVYSGTGRNIFSLVYVPPAAKLSGPLPPARPTNAVAAVAAPTGPPPPPPINLKFFGTEVAGNGKRQAFLLHDEDVYLAAEGDIVARRYKIVSISSSSVQVEDLSNENTQTLQLQTN